MENEEIKNDVVTPEEEIPAQTGVAEEAVEENKEEATTTE